MSKKKEDYRRIPYNIWVTVLGFVFLFVIWGIAFLVCSIGYNADQQVETKIYENSFHCGFNGCQQSYTIEYSNDDTVSNWQDIVCRVLAYILGIVIFIIGMIVWVWWFNTRYWDKNA